MKVALSLLVLMTLTAGGAALQCHVCSETKVNGEVDDGSSVACDDDSIADCFESQNACTTSTFSFAVESALGSSSTETTAHTCGTKPAESAGDAVCDTFAAGFQSIPGFKDFKCDTDYCETDLCNAGQAVKISFLMIAATFALFGLIY